jgi:hypothetical protein
MGPTFHIIGDCYVHGLDDGIVLLGPLPKHIQVQIDKSPSGYSAMHIYRNIKTGDTSQEDPRLPTLDKTIWERLPLRERQLDDPALVQHFRDQRTREVVDSDPRLLPDALRRRGVILQSFDLV